MVSGSPGTSARRRAVLPPSRFVVRDRSADAIDVSSSWRRIVDSPAGARFVRWIEGVHAAAWRAYACASWPGDLLAVASAGFQIARPAIIQRLHAISGCTADWVHPCGHRAHEPSRFAWLAIQADRHRITARRLPRCPAFQITWGPRADVTLTTPVTCFMPPDGLPPVGVADHVGLLAILTGLGEQPIRARLAFAPARCFKARFQAPRMPRPTARADGASSSYVGSARLFAMAAACSSRTTYREHPPTTAARINRPAGVNAQAVQEDRVQTSVSRRAALHTTIYRYSFSAFTFLPSVRLSAIFAAPCWRQRRWRCRCCSCSCGGGWTAAWCSIRGVVRASDTYAAHTCIIIRLPCCYLLKNT